MVYSDTNKCTESSSFVYYILNHQGVVGRVERATLPACVIAKAKAVWSGDWVKSCKGVVDICTAKPIHSLTLVGERLLLGDKDFFQVSLERVYIVVNRQGYFGELTTNCELDKSIVDRAFAIYNVSTGVWVKGGEHGYNLTGSSPLKLQLSHSGLSISLKGTTSDFLEQHPVDLLEKRLNSVSEERNAEDNLQDACAIHSAIADACAVTDTTRNLLNRHMDTLTKLCAAGLMPGPDAKVSAIDCGDYIKVAFTVKDKETIRKILGIVPNSIRVCGFFAVTVRVTKKGNLKVRISYPIF